MFPAFSQLQHPVGLLGASAVTRAAAFNVLAFVVPGMLCALVAVDLRGRLGDAGWIARIGAQALLLSAIAFAAHGLLPLDSSDLDATGSRRHAAAWTAWWLAFLVGATLSWLGLRGTRASRSAGAIAACAVAALVFAVAAPAVLPAGLCQRIAFGAWFVAMTLAGRRHP